MFTTVITVILVALICACVAVLITIQWSWGRLERKLDENDRLLRAWISSYNRSITVDPPSVSPRGAPVSEDPIVRARS